MGVPASKITRKIELHPTILTLVVPKSTLTESIADMDRFAATELMLKCVM